MPCTVSSLSSIIRHTVSLSTIQNFAITEIKVTLMRGCYTRNHILSSSPPPTTLALSLLYPISLISCNLPNKFLLKRTISTHVVPGKRGICVYPCHNDGTVQINNSFSEDDDFEPYFIFPSEKDVPEISDDFYEVLTCRGSGPGGQGCNSSSNKVEIRVDIELLEIFLEDVIPTYDKIKSDSEDKSLTLLSNAHPNTDGTVVGSSSSKCSNSIFPPQQLNPKSAAAIIERLKRNKEIRNNLADNDRKIIISSHSHRSAAANKKECLCLLRKCIHQASFVVPNARKRLSGETESEGRQQRRAPYHYIEERKKRRWKKGNMLRAQLTVKKGNW